MDAAPQATGFALVRRAIESVARQTWPCLEIIVIVDGPDEATCDTLRRIDDPRLRVIRNDMPMGPGAARNRAAQEARGAWIAFLDDDDEWLPDKLTRQLAGRSPEDNVVLSCRCRVETPRAAYNWPQRLYGADEPIDEYLFARRSLRRSDAYLATPTVVLPRRLFLSTGFGTTQQNEDTTLLLRATKSMGAELVMLPDILTVIHSEEARWSTGSVFDWRDSLDWIDAMGSLITPRAYSGFLLVTLGSQAADQGEVKAIGTLLNRAFRHGRPTLRQLALFAAFWTVPQRLRRRCREALSRLGGLRAPPVSSRQPC